MQNTGRDWLAGSSANQFLLHLGYMAWLPSSASLQVRCSLRLLSSQWIWVEVICTPVSALEKLPSHNSLCSFVLLGCLEWRWPHQGDLGESRTSESLNKSIPNPHVPAFPLILMPIWNSFGLFMWVKNKSTCKFWGWFLIVANTKKKKEEINFHLQYFEYGWHQVQKCFTFPR